ncbi:MAG: glycosyltransferase family 4 protein [bacterium]|nr:glycosyltransferase family 4 protein [bacterium]
MRILIFSWRDIKNPKAGGAETYTHELAKRWVKLGHETVLVTALFPDSASSEVLDKVKIFRTAQFSYSPWAYLYYLYQTAKFYRQNLKGQFDIVIDQVHGLPNFTPFFVKEKVIFLPLEVAGSIWRYEIPFPFWLLGWLLELIYLKLFQRYSFITISQSTAKDLKKMGIRKVTVITPGLSFKTNQHVPAKNTFPILISLSRLTPMKRIEQTIEGFKIVAQQFPKSRLYLIGRGEPEYIATLKKLVNRLHLSSNVIFTGFISEKEKQKLLCQAWILVSTSLHEGWGLNVIEAAACGTPAVTYKVPGLVDSVKNGTTGLLCAKNEPQELAKNLSLLLINHELRRTLSRNALKYSRQFTWEKAAKESLDSYKSLLC